ncbi:sulfatase [Verrucomicrobiales bacterium]|jgi:choline-sulfatase|nr:sulfatase [Verrucomicrobiales bacterium]MDB3940256.1 sulfatase [Verrucomicrobiales bacterium]
MNRFLTSLFLIGFLLPAIAAEKKNVVFLICDDLNCDLGSYGHPLVKTPNIDRLAERGTRFDRAYCQYALCGPSRASFLTGLYPDQTLIHKNAIYIREHIPNVTTVSQMYRNNGFFATRIGKLYHYNVPKHIGTSGHDDPYSWNYTINPRGRDVEEESKIFTLKPGTFGATLSWLAAEGTDEEQTDGMIADAAVAELQRYHREDRPFFLAVGLFRPHTPYVAPKKYFDMYPLDQIVVPEVPEGYDKTIPEPALKSIRRKKEQINLADDLAKQAIQAYYATISFADAQVGKVLETLETTGLAKDTVVVFTSDHGYHMGEHGHWQKTTLFENATRVPLIISSPDQRDKGGVVTSPVEMVDIYPTLAELSGLEAPDFLSGVSLAASMDNSSVKPRESALSQYMQGYSIRTERFRYTEWGEKGAEGVELYGCQDDPEELKNLAHSGGEDFVGVISELSEKLHQRIAEANEAPKGIRQNRFQNERRVR